MCVRSGSPATRTGLVGSAYNAEKLVCCLRTRSETYWFHVTEKRHQIRQSTFESRGETGWIDGDKTLSQIRFPFSIHPSADIRSVSRTCLKIYPLEMSLLFYRSIISPAVIPQQISTNADKPYPLYPDVFSAPPRGIRHPFMATFASVVKCPWLSIAQPTGIGSPFLRCTSIWFQSYYFDPSFHDSSEPSTYLSYCHGRCSHI